MIIKQPIQKTNHVTKPKCKTDHIGVQKKLTLGSQVYLPSLMSNKVKDNQR